MNYHVNRDGNELGVYTLEQLREGYKSGQFLPRDLVWREGMPEWVALSELPELAMPGPNVGSGAEGFVPPPNFDGIERTGPAWENPGSGSVFDRAWSTIREAATNPQVFFRSMRLEGGLGQPLIFYVALGYIALVINSVLETPVQLMMGNDFSELVIGLIVSIFLGPLLLPLGAFISAGLTHLFLMMLGGAKKPFEATFRVVCYGYGAVALLQAVPVCGAFVAAIWGIVLEILGLSAAHGIGGGKATAAVLLPMAICCGLALGLFLVFAASMGIALSDF